MNSTCILLMNLWRATQVKLHGKYSSQRVQTLAKHEPETSCARSIALMVLTPLPCLGLTVLIDALPLANPSEGIYKNTMFLWRALCSTIVFTCVVFYQFRKGVQVLPYPIKRLVRDVIQVSAIVSGTLYGFALLIGFPVPFTNVIVTPVWITLVFICLAFQWTGKYRVTPEAKEMLIGMIKLWMCDFLLTIVYPAYYFIFNSLDDGTQMLFGLLLPIIKLFMRNLVARAVKHLGDETPALVVFNADVFGSLFISYCMQSSPAFWMTSVIMTIDILTMGLSLRDIELAREDFVELERRLDEHCPWRSYHGKLTYIDLRGRAPTTLERASIILEQEGLSSSQMQTNSFLHSATLRNVETTALELHRNQLLVVGGKPVDFSGGSWGRGRVQPILPEIGASQTLSSSIKSNYTRKVRQLLYMAEYLLLINYVEVITPLVFSIYLVITYYLPNRAYYTIYDGIDHFELFQRLQNVLLYCLLQFASLLLLNVMLKRMLGHSPIRQLSFVLEKQVEWIQMCLIFWLFYNVQGSLRHFGYDYSFQFNWLSNSTSSSSTAEVHF